MRKCTRYSQIFTDFFVFANLSWDWRISDSNQLLCAMQPPAQAGLQFFGLQFFSVFFSYHNIVFFYVIALCARNKSRVLITNIKQLPSFDCKSSLKVRTRREMKRKQRADFTFSVVFFSHNFADFLLQKNVYFFRTEVEEEKRLLSAAGE